MLVPVRQLVRPEQVPGCGNRRRLRFQGLPVSRDGKVRSLSAVERAQSAITSPQTRGMAVTDAEGNLLKSNVAQGE